MADVEVLLQARKEIAVDELYKASVQAWQVSKVLVKDSKGRPYYKNFNKFFNYEKALKQIDENKKEFSKKDDEILKMVANINKQ